MFCPYCGTTIENKMKFCYSCGETLDFNMKTSESDSCNIKVEDAEENISSKNEIKSQDVIESTASVKLNNIRNVDSSLSDELSNNPPKNSINTPQLVEPLKPGIPINQLEYGAKGSDINKKGTFGENKQLKTQWDNLSTFNKFMTIMVAFAGLCFLIALLIKKPLPIFLSGMQITLVILGWLMKSGKIKQERKWLSYLLIVIGVVLVVPYFSSYSTGQKEKQKDEKNNQQFLNEEDDEDKQTTESKEYFELEIEYSICADGTAEVIGFSGGGNRATIDSQYEGHDVVRISDSAFEGCTTLESVLFWASIEEIGDSAFKDCTSLTEISIPNETIEIGDYAFEGCTLLEELIIWGDPDIGDYAFAGCTSIKEVSFSSDTKYVGEHAFDGCTSLTTVTIWNDETIFGYGAFDNCPNLTNRPHEEEPSQEELYTEETEEITEEITEETQITVTKNEDDFKGMNYCDAENEFREMGFTIFEYKDVKTDDETYNDTICYIEIVEVFLGNSDFKSGDKFDALSTITLYTYKYEESEKPEPVFYSTNDYETAKNGNSGMFSYVDNGSSYDIYWIIDFDEGYVYYFTDGNGENFCDRLKIDSGDLNSNVTITYHDNGMEWSYNLHFHYVNHPESLVMVDNNGFDFQYTTTDLDDALALRDTKTIKDY